MSGPLLHCSPSTGSNFNQISKTATNLLNDIYEKHLLSQTRFENRPSLFAGDTDKLSGTMHAGILRPGQITGGTELMIKNNLRQRVPRKVSESVAMKIQKSLCEIQQNGMPAAAAAAARKQPTGGNEVVVEAGVAPRSKFGNFVYGEHQQQQQQHSAMMIMPMPQSKQYQMGGGGADVNGKISVRAEPVGGNNFYHQDNLCDYSVGGSSGGGCDVGGGVDDNTDADGPAGAGNKYEHRNSKINIMLETAQAMAAAAYFARSVENIFYFICFL